MIYIHVCMYINIYMASLEIEEIGEDKLAREFMLYELTRANEEMVA